MVANKCNPLAVVTINTYSTVQQQVHLTAKTGVACCSLMCQLVYVARCGSLWDATVRCSMLTRSTYLHYALCRAVPCQCIGEHCTCGSAMWSRCQKISQSSRTMVESNMKSQHNLYLACEDSLQRTFFFCTFSCSLLATTSPLGFYCTLTSFIAFSFSVSFSVSAAFSTRLCKTCTLRRTSRLSVCGKPAGVVHNFES